MHDSEATGADAMHASEATGAAQERAASDRPMSKL